MTGAARQWIGISALAAVLAAPARAPAQQQAPAADAGAAPDATPPADAPPAADAAPPAQPEPPAAPAAAPAPAPAPTPTPAPAPAPAAPAPAAAAPAAPKAPPGTALVHVSADYPGAFLELRDFGTDVWRRACAVPCDRRLQVDGADARVLAPGMTPSNSFVIEPGQGTARLRVSGGSAQARTIGLTAMIAGIPVSLGGLGLFGYGKIKEKQAVETAGIVTLAVGAVLVLGSLPFLASGKTAVRDGRGRLIASRSWTPSF